MSTRASNRFDPDEAARLDDELDFLLRSLDDLDAEREQRQISSRRYDELRAEYTTQAADLVRRRSRMARRRTVAPPRSSRSRVLLAVGVAAALIIPASLAATSSGSRAPGQTITGNAGAPPGGSSSPQDPKQLVDAHPEDPQAHDGYAAQLLQTGDYRGAMEQFDAALRLDPRDVQALTYSGWIAFLGGLPDQALPRLTQAESIDPTYSDPHALRGIVLLRGRSDRAGAAGELRRYLALEPDGPMASQVQAVLDQMARQK